ncbi:hypothetical protein VTH82DRAFT_5475 [Thermothelomyces myriococcoides]
MKSNPSVLVLGLGASAALAANFSNSCDAASIKVSGNILTATCSTIFGQPKCSKLDLDKCIKNEGGTLRADPSGTGPHLGDQCVECTNDQLDDGSVIGGQPSFISCKCNPGTGAAQVDWPTAIFDLNTIVDNHNGMLECYRTQSTEC